jgi:simple sugar transport system ATP-binding protein
VHCLLGDNGAGKSTLIGDTFTLLDRGRALGTFKKSEISRDEVLHMMAGGQEMQDLVSELGDSDHG